MEHIQGYTGSHWMPPLGECLRRIAPAAAVVDKFFENTQYNKKTQLLAINYGTLRSLPQRPGFKNQLMHKDATAIIVSMPQYLYLRVSFFIRIKGFVNFHETTPIHKQRVLAR